MDALHRCVDVLLCTQSNTCEENDGRSVSGGLEIISGCVHGFLAVHIYPEPVLPIRRIRSSVGPPKHQGGPCSQRCFNLSFVLNLASSGYENMNDNLL